MDLKKLKAELDAAIARMKEISGKDAPTAEEKSEFDNLDARCEEIAKDIERAKRFQEKEESRKRLSLPVEKPLEVEREDSGIVVTREQGTDDKGRCVVWKDLGEQLRAVVAVAKEPLHALESRERLELSNRILRAAATGMSESVMADGGFLVQTDQSKDLIQRSYETGKLARLVNRLQVQGNGIKIPAVDETSRATGSRYGGLQSYWLDEAGKFTASKPKFTYNELKLKKLISLVYLTDELLEDAPALQTWVLSKFPEEMGFMLDDAILNGDGVGKPLGILNSKALIAVAKDSGQAANTISAQNLANMYARLWEPSLQSAVFVYNQGLKSALMTLSLTIGSNTYPVMLPGGVTGNMVGSVPTTTILGVPAFAAEQCAAFSSQGDILLIDPKRYTMIEKGSIEQASSIHVRFEYQEQAFRFAYRCDGACEWKQALTPFKGSNTLSPYVTLAAR